MISHNADFKGNLFEPMWFNNVPQSWNIDRAKNYFKKMERPVRPTDKIITCFRDGEVTLRMKRRVEGFTESLKEIGYQGIRRGDLVIHSMDASAGAVGVSDFDGKGSPVYSVCKPRANTNVYYFAYLLREMARNGWIGALSKGIRERSSDFRYSDFSAQLLPVPPLAIQGVIVQYLDYADQIVRGGVSRNQRLVELMEEYKRAVIQQAVTRGLDPDVPLKPSGVEWLGDIPEHWEVRRLSTVTDMRVSNVDKHINDDEIPVRLCNYVDVYKNDLIDGTIDFMPASATEDEISRFHLRIGDVLITKDSETWDDIGVPALVVETAPDLVSGYHLALLRPDTTQLLGSYLFRALQSRAVAYQFHVEARGVTRYGLSHSGILSAAIPLPPVEEQAAIVAHLDKLTSDIDAAIAHTRREIELLEEYRTRLIADVVTGKLDVREAAANLPDVNPDDIQPLAEGDEADD